MNKDEEIKKLKRNNLILAGVIVVLCGILLYSYARINSLQEINEDYCLVTNNLVELINQIRDTYSFDWEEIPTIECYSGDAERRLYYEK